MRNDKFPITPKGYQMLTEELSHLKSIERPTVITEIAEARAHGDLSENAEYNAAREKQSFIEAKIADLENKIARAEIINIKELTDSQSVRQVKFGATVRIIDEDTDKESEYSIVGDYEADLNKGMISILSPLAKALLGKSEGDSIEVITPKGTKYYNILSVLYE